MPQFEAFNVIHCKLLLIKNIKIRSIVMFVQFFIITSMIHVMWEQTHLKTQSVKQNYAYYGNVCR